MEENIACGAGSQECSLNGALGDYRERAIAVISFGSSLKLQEEIMNLLAAAPPKSFAVIQPGELLVRESTSSDCLPIYGASQQHRVLNVVVLFYNEYTGINSKQKLCANMR